ncbi:MAG: hypothetical protein FWF58_00605, partial [Firmicutes bacterium]|nr:hypothetical protein [Bacillota bacterium]
MSNLNNIQSALALCEKSIELDRCIDDIKPIAIVEDIQYKRDQTSIDVVVYSLGCKTNQCEGEALVAQFGKIGIRASDLMQVASVYIINTCSVTVEADRKSRQVCRRAKSLNPNAVVYVCGCAVANCKDEYFAGAKVIAGAIDKNHIVSTIVNMHSFEHNSHFNSTVSKKVVNKVKRARKHIKIQDGCNDFCSFCIIPYLRGRSKSRDVIDIANDVLQA